MKWNNCWVHQRISTGQEVGRHGAEYEGNKITCGWHWRNRRERFLVLTEEEGEVVKCIFMSEGSQAGGW